MLAAALTIWGMFSVWLIADFAGFPRAVARTAMLLLALELVALAVWSYGSERCDERTCAPIAQASGIAARVDVPILAGVFVVIALLRLGRRARTTGRA
jgi:hypothetical protein